MFKVSICASLILICTIGKSQHRCGTVEYTQELKSVRAIPADDRKFEQWLQSKIQLRQSSRTQATQATYRVPVVVHVIHNGEAVGSGTNLSEAQILSQIKVLNEDFTRQNADKTSTPSEFASVAGSMNIEFVLAKQDPAGIATNGIVRVKGAKTQWQMSDNYQLKAQSYWPAEDYLNIWVCNITDYLGYTQFPEYNLPGLENASTNRLTDGIVIAYRCFGSANDGQFNLDSQYDLGRTVTHEIGHFFGLRHIWGDDGQNCSGEDYVSDTPNQSGSSSNCPSHPVVSCSTTSMFQNFLDYTDDQCMNLFTQGQVARMTVVLENSVRRSSLLNSLGVLDPVPVSNDLGIVEITSPTDNECSNTITPKVLVRNYGNTAITSATIHCRINDILEETKVVTFNLSGYLDVAEISFASTSVSSGKNSIEFEIAQTNGGADPVFQNNQDAIDFSIPQFSTIPFSETFDVFPDKWVTENPDEQLTWELVTAPSNYLNNKSLFMNFYDYEDKLGELDVLLSPVLDLSSAPVAALVFDVAHARYQTRNDRLKIVVLRDCESLNDGTTVYDKMGAALATTASTSDAFVPDASSDWRREIVNLDDFVGYTRVQVAIVGINGWGNNVYIDNVGLLTSELADVSLARVVSPSSVTCSQNPTVNLVVQNLGTVTITNFKVEYSVNGQPKQTALMDNVSLASVGELNVALPALALNEGSNTITIDVIEPNGVTDQTPANNTFQYSVIVKKDAEPIPLRQNFDAAFDSWTAVNPTGGMNWTTTATNYATSIMFNSFDNTNIGEQAWLVSPVLDFSSTNSASVVFDLSKRARTGKEDEFKVFASSDCGNTYEPLSLFINSTFASQEWPAPDNESDWVKNFRLDLSDFAGKEQVRIAFVATNKNGNNMYLDNIEFYTTDDPELMKIETLYSIMGYDASDVQNSELKVIFNLPERQTVQYAIVDTMGRMFAEGTFENVLNQTWMLDEEQLLPSGMYIVRMKIGTKMVAHRIIIGR